MNKWQIPTDWEWKTLSGVSEINPRRPRIHRDDNAPTSFVPMEDVDELEGKFKQVQVRPYGEVKSGYTYFEQNDVLYAKITPSMENGKTAIARGLTDGFGFGTTEFHVFRPNYGILPEYLHSYIRRTAFRQEAKQHFRGAVGQQRVPQDFLVDYPVPIPYPNEPERSLAEQRRIVARIEALLAEVREMRTLQEEISTNIWAFYRSLVFDYSDWTPSYFPMSKLVTRIDTNEAVQNETLYQFAGVKSFGGGVFKGKAIYGRETAYQRLTRLKMGNFTYPKLMAWEGALGSVPAACDGCVVSPEYPVFEVNEVYILPEVLDIYFRTESVWPVLANLSSGTNARRRRLHPDVFLTYEFPVPPMEVQQYLREAVRQFGNQEGISETRKLLSDLEPAILDQAFRGEL